MISNTKKRQKGFTLIELMVVIIIIGVLASVAIPLYLGYTEDSRKADGKTLLGTIITAEKTYYIKNATFTDSQADLESFLGDLGEAEQKWDINLSGASDNGFTVRVEGKSGTDFEGLWVEVSYTKDPASQSWTDGSGT
ncbi:MAG: prepilin-type N-terminal cleavage/methylation domain-containing protein [Thermodesulfobacteriota bacterium]|nr:prepilin-type N-terminal cleavage/methylation domain-containing protein [Thermodesulfobacteriota bacterium]